MITIHGRKLSRAGRVLWTLEELGIDYRHVPTDPFSGGSRTPEHLALNPMGKVPVLVEGEFVLTESIAINHYLARSTWLLPEDPQVQARVLQWTSWAVTEVEFHFTAIVREQRRAGDETPDQARIDKALATLADTMTALETWLAGGNAYVAGPEFTVGDINAAFPISGVAARIDMNALPQTADWLTRCTGREAWQRVLAKEEVLAA